ncbi:MAG TPA: hypothetical protein VGL65_14210 [Gemmatimonadales bacterium]|jgi:hypothetical protein
MHQNASVIMAALGSALILCAPRSARASAPVDPCMLLTTAQVSSAIGGTAQAGQPIYTTGCSWSSESPKAMVTIALESDSMYMAMKAAKSPMIVNTAISGVGDDAYYKTLGVTSTLTVKKGNTVFVVRVYGITDPSKQREIEKTLATDVAARL